MSALALLSGTLDTDDRRAALARMFACVPHRAVDGVFTAETAGASIGVAARATTLRERAGLAPKIDSTGRIAIVADARIDNAVELARALGVDDRSDSELLLAGYARWDIALASRLHGDFAFVIWDQTRDRVYAARDAFGSRALFWSAGKYVAVATEVEQLLAAGVSREVDAETIEEFLREDYRSVERTFFRAIRRIPPGHQLVLERGDGRVRRWFEPPPYELRLPSAADYRAEVRRTFRASVEARLVSEHIVIAQLSGGLDSSAIICMGATLARKSRRLRAVSAIYPGLPCDESEWIEAALAHSGIEGDRFDGTVSEWSDYAVPPLHHPGAPPTSGRRGERVIVERSSARVVLSGSGGDHLFAERGVFRDLAGAGRFRELYRQTKGARYAVGSRASVVRDAVRGAVRGALLDGDGGARSHTQRETWRWLTSAPACWNVEAQELAAAKLGLQIRYPFLDARLAELVLSIPWQQRLPHGRTKALLRDALGEILPEKIRERMVVTSFESSVVHHVSLHAEHLEEVLQSGSWLSAPWVDRVEARSALSAFRSGRERDWRAASRVWNVAMLELWLRRVAGL